jgi:hypothetical protein
MLSFKIFVDGIFGYPENLDCCCCFFFFLCYGRMPLIDLLLMNLDVVLQLGKIVAGIEQKPVSLNDIVTYGALIKNERDY